MTTRTLTAFYLILISVVTLSACNKEPPKPQAVVVNLARISEAVYLPKRVKAFSEALSTEINAEISELSSQYKQELDDKKASFGDSPTQEQEDELKRMTDRLRKQFNRTRMKANTRLSEEKKAFSQSIVDIITPVVEQVATEHGAGIVLKYNTVAWSEDTLDITSEVISRLPAEETRDPAAPDEDTGTDDETAAASTPDSETTGNTEATVAD